VGAYVPERRISNARIAAAIPGWSAERIEEKTGIRERRFLWDFDEATGRALVPPDDATLYPRNNTEMCQSALLGALAMADMDASELDALLLITCSPDQLNFSHDAMQLHHRLGMRTDAYAMVIDSGCGGTLYAMDMARKMLAGGTFRNIAVVGSNFTSAYVDREVFTRALEGEHEKEINAFLSMYVFGDGAGAVVLHGDERPEVGILASMAGSACSDLVVRRGGGALHPPHAGRARPSDHAYIIDGRLVARSFLEFMSEAMDAVLAQRPDLAEVVSRYYLHQPNLRLLERFIDARGLPRDQVASHVETHGNTSAAGMLILLAEDVAARRVMLDSGDIVLISAVGAGVHFGAQLIRL
jgi:3-oxoacyl-[acyl-carrier-protein] synthase III